MSISIVIGKPGSGKSYHITKYIAETLIEFARKGELVRKIYTNVSLNVDALVEYVHVRSRVPAYDVAGRVSILTDIDLRFDRSRLCDSEVKEERRGYRRYQVIDPLSKAFFWNRFPDDSLIIIDEIQKYIGSVKEYGESENKSIVEYFSLHRHKRHDWIFLTQALTSLSLEVRKVSEVVYEVFNAKMMSLPFPISIPMRDVEILLKGFGVNNQVYRVRQGILEGSYKVNFDGPVQVVTMTREIFALYSTHTQIDASKDQAVASLGGSDSVLPFELGPGSWRRALWWFLKKHFLHLAIKIVVIVIGLHMVFGFIRVLMSGSWTGVVFGESSAVSSDVNSLPVAEVFPTVESDEDQGELINVSVLSEEDADDRENLTKLTNLPFKDCRGVAVLDDYLYCNGCVYGRGDLVNGLRIVSVSALYGVQYEDACLVYLLDLYEFERLARFVSRLQLLEDASAD